MSSNLAAAEQTLVDTTAPALSTEEIAFADADFAESVAEAVAQQGLDDAQAADAGALSLGQEGAQVGLDAAQAQFNSAIAAFASASSSADLLPAQLDVLNEIRTAGEQKGIKVIFEEVGG